MTKIDMETQTTQNNLKGQDALEVVGDEGEGALAVPEEEPEEERYALFDKEVADILRADDRYLDEFYDYLTKSGLADKTIGRHMLNAQLFVRDWLGAREGMSMEDGPAYIGGFLGDYYIRRCMWSTPANIKTTATSIKKFYKCMTDLGHITSVDYRALVETIKERTGEWQWKCSLYNDPNSEWEDIAGEFDIFPF